VETGSADLERLMREFLGAYARGDRDRAARFLDERLTAYVTNADAGVDVIRGRDRYMERVPDLDSAGGSLTITQVAPVDGERVLAMVEIHADLGGKRLHNFAAFLVRAPAGAIAELWMVEARPAYSDEFWS
jgi:hypothetical protein